VDVLDRCVLAGGFCVSDDVSVTVLFTCVGIRVSVRLGIGESVGRRVSVKGRMVVSVGSGRGVSVGCGTGVSVGGGTGVSVGGGTGVSVGSGVFVKGHRKLIALAALFLVITLQALPGKLQRKENTMDPPRMRVSMTGLANLEIF
jgi:hypothetical protein